MIKNWLGKLNRSDDGVFWKWEEVFGNGKRTISGLQG